MSSPHRTKMQEIFKHTLGKSGVEVSALGQALAAQRDKVVIATKFGLVFDEQTWQGAGPFFVPL